MFRFALFWLTGGAILLAAGLAPTPSSANFPDFLRPAAEIVLDQTAPDQPAQVATVVENTADVSPSEADRKPLVQQVNLPKPNTPEKPSADILPRLASLFKQPSLPEVGTATDAVVEDSFVSPAEARVVNFDFDLVELDKAAIAELNALVIWLKANPNTEISIYGHTDRVGPEEYNIQLGEWRAKRVAHFLLQAGVSEDRFTVIKSYGESEPLIETERGTRENRRVQVQAM